jgi:DNA-binding NarL/FixJ family response regulator
MPLTLFTPRQRTVVRLICEGRGTKAIANALHIAESSVSNHKAKIVRRIRVSCPELKPAEDSTYEILRWAAVHGMLNTKTLVPKSNFG